MARFTSSTLQIPEATRVPRHVAIIMDGNGRWAKKRFLPRVAGHRRGLEAVREAVKMSIQFGVSHLTLFAFSSENWRRPKDEVSFLMQLFVKALQQEVRQLNDNGIRLRVVGDLSPLDASLVKLIAESEALTADNTGLTLTICANYGGRWDIMQAVNRMCTAHPEKAGQYSERDLMPWLAMADTPEPDLFIRTGGEQRISNFLLWQLAYTELYFTDALWPDFDARTYLSAIHSYRKRERRFGRTSEQLTESGPDENPERVAAPVLRG
ncbi:MAG: di-trans,poly-cis-decaprenylcistransferase [Betaproteobacteria bacterium]|nr:di-trans,poly-cis-decaprenylcistransferase [Betaproteobacteria bacterium]